MNHTMIITPNASDPEVIILSEEFKSRGYEVDYFKPSEFTVKVNMIDFHERFNHLNPQAALVRGFGIAPTQKIFFRLDLLTAIEAHGIKLMNTREALEIASDKFLTSIFLANHGIPTPKTIVCENANDALNGFEELGSDVVLKPLYGSKGIGVTRINDKAFAENVLYSLGQLNHVFYLQAFIEHANRDIRVFVLGKKVIAGMYRISDNWKTNIHAGARMESIELDSELENLALRAASVTKTQIAGVDIIESEEGLQVIEVNSIPGFTALQKTTDLNLASEIVSFFLENMKE
jgi:RimK family alpha-L-glutamate ligase